MTCRLLAVLKINPNWENKQIAFRLLGKKKKKSECNKYFCAMFKIIFICINQKSSLDKWCNKVVLK